MPGSRRLQLAGAVLAALAAVLLVLGAWSTSWWSGAEGPMSFSAGPRYAELCGEGPCRETPLASLGGDAWMQTGLGALSAGIVGAVLLLVAGVRSIRRPGARSVLPGAAGLACAAAMLLGIAFVWLAPAEVAGLDLGWAVTAYFAGAALGAGSAALLRP